MERIRRKPFIEYEEALEKFSAIRKEMNELKEKNKMEFLMRFNELKQKAKNEDAIAMDVLAYYYKSGVPGLLAENYKRYIAWEFVAAARGNKLAIEKLQFMLNYAEDEIIACKDYETIKYKNDIDRHNVIHVLGKALAKIIVREFLKAFPVDLAVAKDEYQPYQQKYYVELNRYIEQSIPLTIKFLLS